MIGLILQYRPKKGYSLVKLNHLIFGRIIKTVSGGDDVFYYQKGLLHDIQYRKLLNGKYFIRNINIKDELKSLLDEYCQTYKLYEDVRVFHEGELTTGLKHWMEIASEKGYKVRKWI